MNASPAFCIVFLLYIYMCVCVYIYIYIYIYIHTHTHTHINVCTHNHYLYNPTKVAKYMCVKNNFKILLEKKTRRKNEDNLAIIQSPAI